MRSWIPLAPPAATRAGDQAAISFLIVVGAVTGALIASLAWVLVVGAPPTGSTSPVVAIADSGDDGWAVTGPQWERDVVRIRSERCDDTIRGTGVVVDGAVITNRHVVDGARSVVVTTADGVDHPVVSSAVSDRVDLAVLRAGDLGSGRELAAESAATGTGPLVMAGFPGGGPLDTAVVALDGSIEGLRYPHPPSAIRLDTEVVPGDSGSPVVDSEGAVVALVYARETVDGRGLAIGAADVAIERGRVRTLDSADC